MEKQYVFVIIEEFDNGDKYECHDHYTEIYGDNYYLTFEEAKQKIDEIMPDGKWNDKGYEKTKKLEYREDEEVPYCGPDAILSYYTLRLER